MTDEIEQLLRNLHLKNIAAIVDDELAHADQHQLSYSAFLARLLRAQDHHRQETALAWRITQAKLPEQWTLESFPFKRQPGVAPKQIRALADLEFVAKAENIVFIGPTGVGKTGLASGLLLKALQNGYRARFVRAQDLFDEMYASLADRSTRQLLNMLIRIDVLHIMARVSGEQSTRRGPPQSLASSVPHHSHRRPVLAGSPRLIPAPASAISTTGVDADAPVDAQNAPTGCLQNRTERGFAQRPHPSSLSLKHKNTNIHQPRCASRNPDPRS